MVLVLVHSLNEFIMTSKTPGIKLQNRREGASLRRVQALVLLRAIGQWKGRATRMNKKSERKQNLVMIIEALRRVGAMTQARLKEYCGLQASTVSYLVNDLKSYELVKDLGQVQQDGKVGKPGNTICLNNDKALFLGIYVEDERLFDYLIGIDGSTLGCHSVDLGDGDMEEIILAVIRENLARYPQIKGVGLTIKAIVYNDGSIKSGARHHKGSEEQSWSFAGLPDALRAAFPEIPIIVENDANSVAELYCYERKPKTGNMVAYVLNHAPFGIGCGLMINGSIFRGASGAAGEFFGKNTNIGEIAKTIHNEADFIHKFMPLVLSHVMETAYFLDPECIVLTGSYFDEFGLESVRAVEALFAQVPMPVIVASGKDRLNPAKGVALLAINNYVTSFVEEVVKR